jgi:hypothetical protein
VPVLTVKNDTMCQESMTAIAKKTKRTITEDLGLTEIICPSAVPVTIENITKIVLREAAAKRINKHPRFK